MEKVMLQSRMYSLRSVHVPLEVVSLHTSLPIEVCPCELSSMWYVFPNSGVLQEGIQYLYSDRASEGLDVLQLSFI